MKLRYRWTYGLRREAKTASFKGSPTLRKPLHAVQFHPESVLSEYGAQIVANFLQVAR